MTLTFRQKPATSDNLKSLDEVFDDLIEAVNHAEQVEKERDDARAEVDTLRALLSETTRLLRAIVGRKAGETRIERSELEDAPEVLVEWVDDDVCVVRAMHGEGAA